MSPQVLIPRASSSRSKTRPMPLTFLVGRSRTKARMEALSEGRRNCPLGLFLFEQILARRALAAMPALTVILAAANTSARSCCTASSGCSPCSAQYDVIFRYASSILADSNRGS